MSQTDKKEIMDDQQWKRSSEYRSSSEIKNKISKVVDKVAWDKEGRDHLFRLFYFIVYENDIDSLKV